jgi:hypothetical protein
MLLLKYQALRRDHLIMATDIKLYNVKEIAEILHLSVYRIRQFIRTGKLKGHVHMGRCNTKRLFVLEQDLRRFISEEFLEDYWPGLKRPKQ